MTFFGPRGGKETGETLIEVLLASALMGIVVLAVVGGISTMLLGSTVHRQQADANLTLTSAMEYLKAPTVNRICPPSAYTGLPGNVTVDSIEYQTTGVDPITGNPTLVWSTSAPACSASPALSLQRITLRYSTGPSGRVTPKLSFVKGDY